MRDVLITFVIFLPLLRAKLIPAPFTWTAQQFGKTYFGEFENERSIDDARQLCDSVGGSILTIQSEDENDFIRYEIPRSSWIDVHPVHFFRWRDGTEMVFHKYIPIPGACDCGIIFQDGDWMRRPCDQGNRYVICEVVNRQLIAEVTTVITESVTEHVT